MELQESGEGPGEGGTAALKHIQERSCCIFEEGGGCEGMVLGRRGEEKGAASEEAVLTHIQERSCCICEGEGGWDGLRESGEGRGREEIGRAHV